MSHDLSFDVSQNGVQQPPSHDQQMMSGQMDSGNMNVGGSSGNSYLDRLRTESAHPGAIISHCMFKAAAIFMYIFGGWFTRDSTGRESGAKFITVTVIIILLLAADFWVVKNVTGRLLVGLRWWNKVEGDTTRWIFECAEALPNGSPIQRNRFDANIFWTVMYATPLIWVGMLIIGILKFQLGWLIIVFMALGLSMANVYGYYKCSNDQKAKFQQMMQQGAQQGAMAMVRSNVLGMLTGSNASQPNQSNNTNTYM